MKDNEIQEGNALIADKTKETYGVEVGDKITCHWEDWEEDRTRKSTGIVYEVDHNDNFSKEVATFRFKNYQGNECWFCGLPTKIVKSTSTTTTV